MKTEIENTLKKYNLTVESVFVPFSQSRNSQEKTPSLNWKVTLKQGRRNILTTDYMAGCAHAPSYKQGMKYDTKQLVAKECETGVKSTMITSSDIHSDKRYPILPDAASVIYSLLMDSDVLDYSSFEEWADSLGYDPDSREAEKTYNACVKIALQFRRIGESAIAELREAYQDY